MVRTLYRDASLTDALSPNLQLGISLIVEDRTIVWMGGTGDETAVPAAIPLVDQSGDFFIQILPSV